MKKLFVELVTSGTYRELTLVQIPRDLRAFRKGFCPEKEGCAQEAYCPPFPPCASKLPLKLLDQVTMIYRSGFLNLSIVVAEDIQIVCVGGYPVSCRMLNCTLGLCPLDAAATSHSPELWQSDIAKCSQGRLGEAGGQNCLWLRTMDLDKMHQTGFSISPRSMRKCYLENWYKLAPLLKDSSCPLAFYNLSEVQPNFV